MRTPSHVSRLTGSSTIRIIKIRERRFIRTTRQQKPERPPSAQWNDTQVNRTANQLFGIPPGVRSNRSRQRRPRHCKPLSVHHIRGCQEFVKWHGSVRNIVLASASSGFDFEQSCRLKSAPRNRTTKRHSQTATPARSRREHSRSAESRCLGNDLGSETSATSWLFGAADPSRQQRESSLCG